MPATVWRDRTCLRRTWAPHWEEGLRWFEAIVDCHFARIERPKVAPRAPTAFAVAPPVRPERGVTDCAAFQEAPVVAPPFVHRSPTSVRFSGGRVGVRRTGVRHFRR
jgi:hypothetical protein